MFVFIDTIICNPYYIQCCGAKIPNWFTVWVTSKQLENDILKRVRKALNYIRGINMYVYTLRSQIQPCA